jgi:hypothetical protein
MAGMIIWSITVFGCAILFFGMGVYAEKREKPMWFWSGSTVDESKVSDVRAYNKENANMWKIYSLWYWASGIAYFFKEWIGVAILVLGCTLGIGLLVTRYTKIEKKYTKK